MITRTISVKPEEDVVSICNSWEEAGWSVRQIVLNTTYGFTYVILEREPEVVVEAVWFTDSSPSLSPGMSKMLSKTPL